MQLVNSLGVGKMGAGRRHSGLAEMMLSALIKTIKSKIRSKIRASL